MEVPICIHSVSECACAHTHRFNQHLFVLIKHLYVDQKLEREGKQLKSMHCPTVPARIQAWMQHRHEQHHSIQSQTCVEYYTSFLSPSRARDKQHAHTQQTHASAHMETSPFILATTESRLPGTMRSSIFNNTSPSCTCHIQATDDDLRENTTQNRNSGRYGSLVVRLACI